MFQESLVESTSLLRGRNRWPAVISFALQATIATSLIVLPLLHPEILPLRAPRISLTAPGWGRRWWRSNGCGWRRRARRQCGECADAGSQVFYDYDFRTRGAAVDQPALAVERWTWQGRVGVRCRCWGRVGLRDRMWWWRRRGPVHMSTGVMAGQLLEPIQPEYPMIARLSRAEGTVVVQAVISKSGRIESARVVSGPPVLQAAALQAVRAARYRPFLLNGLPTEVETTVSITFRLGD